MADNRQPTREDYLLSGDLRQLKRVASAAGLTVAEYIRQHPTGAKLLAKIVDPEAIVKDFLKDDEAKAALLAQTEEDVDVARQLRLLGELVMAGVSKLLPLIL